jgi:hypothetical protein
LSKQKPGKHKAVPSKLEIGKAESRNGTTNQKFLKQKTETQNKSETAKAENRNSFQLLPFVLFIIVVMMAMSSSASFSMGRVSTEAIPHSSRSSSNQSADSSASCNAPPSLEMNSSSERARDASFSL